LRGREGNEEGEERMSGLNEVLFGCEFVVRWGIEEENEEGTRRAGRGDLRE